MHTRKQMGSIPISSTIYDRLVERLTRLPFKEEIAGSNPVPVTIIAGSLFGDYGR